MRICKRNSMFFYFVAYPGENSILNRQTTSKSKHSNIGNISEDPSDIKSTSMNKKPSTISTAGEAGVTQVKQYESTGQHDSVVTHGTHTYGWNPQYHQYTEACMFQ